VFPELFRESRDFLVITSVGARQSLEFLDDVLLIVLFERDSISTLSLTMLTVAAG